MNPSDENFEDAPVNKLLIIEGDSAMEELGRLIGTQLGEPPRVIFLDGELGAGKTTLVRGILRALGWQQYVKSPTYTLVESYLLRGIECHHFDLYRLSDPEELEFLGIRDYFTDNSFGFIEWPQKGGDFIPDCDLLINSEYCGRGRRLKFSGTLASALTPALEQALKSK